MVLLNKERGSLHSSECGLQCHLQCHFLLGSQEAPQWTMDTAVDRPCIFNISSN
jgi:hypothetical protein